MAGALPGGPFERYADNIVIHCSSRGEALAIKAAVEERPRRCRLEAHRDKTRIAYCRDPHRRGGHEHIQWEPDESRNSRPVPRKREGEASWRHAPVSRAGALKSLHFHRILIALLRPRNPLPRGAKKWGGSMMAGETAPWRGGKLNFLQSPNLFISVFRRTFPQSRWGFFSGSRRISSMILCPRHS